MQVHTKRRSHVRFSFGGAVQLEDEYQDIHLCHLTDLSAGGFRVVEAPALQIST